MADYAKYGLDHEPTFVGVWVSFIDEDGGHDNAFQTNIKTNHEFIESEDDWIFFYGLSLDEIEEGVAYGTVFEGEWVITGIDYAADTLYL